MNTTIRLQNLFNPKCNYRGEEKEVLKLGKFPQNLHGSLKVGRLVLVIKVGYLKKFQFEVEQSSSGIDHIAGLASALQKALRKTHVVGISKNRKIGFDHTEIITVTPKKDTIPVRDKLRLAQKMRRKIAKCLKKELPFVESRPL